STWERRSRRYSPSWSNVPSPGRRVGGPGPFSIPGNRPGILPLTAQAGQRNCTDGAAAARERPAGRFPTVAALSFRVGGAARAARRGGAGRGGRLVLERLQDGLALVVRAGQLEYTLLRLAQLRVTGLEQAHALLVARQGLLQPQAAVLQVADGRLQLDEG